MTSVNDRRDQLDMNKLTQYADSKIGSEMRPYDDKLGDYDPTPSKAISWRLSRLSCNIIFTLENGKEAIRSTRKFTEYK